MNKLRVYHIPQVPGEAFLVPVESIEQAKQILLLLWNYDLFQLEQNIKPDYSSVSGLEVFEDNAWNEWWSEDGEDILELMGVD